MTAWYFPVFDMGHHTVFLVCEKFNLDFEKGFGESDWVTNRKKITEEERWKGEVGSKGGRGNAPENEMKKPVMRHL